MSELQIFFNLSIGFQYNVSSETSKKVTRELKKRFLSLKLS